jgi:hypothetical protein
MVERAVLNDAEADALRVLANIYIGTPDCHIRREDANALINYMSRLENERSELRSALTASEKHLAVANKLWRLCVDDDWPWADGSTQDALNELGLLYPKDMTEEDESEQCKNCEGECETCYRAVDRIEDAAMEKANG